MGIIGHLLPVVGRGRSREAPALDLRWGEIQFVDCQDMLVFVLFLPCCPAFWLFYCLLVSLLEEEINKRS